MALLRTRRRLIKDLRVGIRLLLPEDPGRERMIDMVRLYDPDARPASGGRICVDISRQIYLTSDTIDAAIAAEAQVPPGLTSAYFAQLTARGSPTSAHSILGSLGEKAMLLVNGLAVRMGGIAWPQPAVVREPLCVTMFTPEPVTAADVIGVLWRQMPGLRPYQDVTLGPLGVGTWRDDEGQLEAEFYPRDVPVLTANPPAALGDWRRFGNTKKLCATLIRLKQPAERADPAMTRFVGEAALALGSVFGGMCTDVFDCRVLRFEDLIIR